MALDPAVVAAYIGAQASLDSASIIARATLQAGALTLIASLGAFAGAFAIVYSARVETKNRKKREEQARQRRLQALAQTFSAEIGSLQVFLNVNNVVTTLTSAARSGGNWHFHPGNNWLKTYSYDPTTVGNFGGDLPGRLTSYYCVMLNEIGRLKWLHETKPEQIGDSGWKLELQNSANTLSHLLISGNHLLERLAAVSQPTLIAHAGVTDPSSTPGTKILWGREVTV